MKIHTDRLKDQEQQLQSAISIISGISSSSSPTITKTLEDDEEQGGKSKEQGKESSCLPLNFDSNSLKSYLEKALEPLNIDANPSVLSDYIIALLSQQSMTADLMKEELLDFLKEDTSSFINSLLLAIETNSYYDNPAETKATSSPQTVSPRHEESYQQQQYKQQNSDQYERDNRDDNRNYRRNNNNSNNRMGGNDNYNQRSDDRYRNDFTGQKRRRSIDQGDDDGDRRFPKVSRSDNSYSGSRQSDFPRGRGGGGGGYMGRGGMGGGSNNGPQYNNNNNINNGNSSIGMYNGSDERWNHGPNGPGSDWNVQGGPMPMGGGFGDNRMGMRSGSGDGRPPMMGGRMSGYPDSRGDVRRLRCRDFDEKGFCLRGDQCPYDHGIDTMNRPPFGISPNPIGILPVHQPPIMQQNMRPFPYSQSSAPGFRNNQMPFSADVNNTVDSYDPDQSLSSPTNIGFPNSNLTMVDTQSWDYNNSSSSPEFSRGRGRGRGVFRGRGGGRGGTPHFTPYHLRKQNDTIVVENIPEEFCTLDNVNDYFKKFGTITNIQMQNRLSKAVIQYSSIDEAKKAWSSPETIFGNRFVKVYFMSIDEKPASSGSNNGINSLGGDDATPTSSTLPAPAASGSPTTTQIPTHRTPPISNAETQAKKLEDKKSQLRAMMELQKQKEALISKQISYQKEIMEKLSTKKLSVKEKETLMSALKMAEESTRLALESAASVSATVKAAVPVPVVKLTPEEREKERLDRELDLLNKLNEGDIDPALKAQLESLEAEAKSLGVDPNAPSTSFRGGRGRGRGSWRGMGRGAKRSFNLDNRTTKIQISGIKEDTQDMIKSQLELSGPITLFKFNQEDSTAIAQFQFRLHAESALGKGLKIPGIQLSWFNESNLSSEPTQESVDYSKIGGDVDAVEGDGVEGNAGEGGSSSDVDNDLAGEGASSLDLLYDEDEDEETNWKRK